MAAGATGYLLKDTPGDELTHERPHSGGHGRHRGGDPARTPPSATLKSDAV